MKKSIHTIKLPKFLSDTLALLSSKIFIIIVQFVIGIFITRLLGPSGKGIVTTALVIPTIVISLADLGLRQSITYFMGKKLYSDQQIISTITLSLIFTSILGIIGALFAYLISGFQLRYGWGVLIIPLGLIPATLVISYSNGVLMAKRQVTKLSIINVLPEIIYLFLALFLVLLKLSQPELVLLGHMLASTITAGYLLFTIKKYGELKPEFNSDLFWNILKKGVIFALALFVISLNYSVDVIILDRLTNAAEVGIYSIGVTVANMLWLIPNAIHMTNSSYSANAIDNLEYSKKSVFLLKVVLWVSLLPLLILFFISPYVIPWIYGKDFSTSGIVVQAILPGVWAMLIFKILNSDLAGRGRPEAALWVYLLAAGINIGLNIWWDPLYGAIGAAWASSVSYSFGGLLFAVAYGRISCIKFKDLLIPNKHDIQNLIGLIKAINVH